MNSKAGFYIFIHLAHQAVYSRNIYR